MLSLKDLAIQSDLEHGMDLVTHPIFDSNGSDSATKMSMKNKSVFSCIHFVHTSGELSIGGQ